MNYEIQAYTGMNPTELDLLVEEVVNKINDTKSYKRIEMTKIIENLDVSERLKIWVSMGLGISIVLDGISDKKLVNEIVNTLIMKH